MYIQNSLHKMSREVQRPIDLEESYLLVIFTFTAKLVPSNKKTNYHQQKYK